MRMAVYTIEEFCMAHKLSKAKFYTLLQEGKGPRLMTGVGRKNYISVEAAAEWRQRMEQETSPEQKEIQHG